MQGRNLSLIILAGFGLNLTLSQVSLARDITFVSPQGQFTTQRDVTRNGNTVTIDRTTTLPNGVKTDYSNTFNRSGNHGFTDSATRTYTRPDGTNLYQVRDQRSYGDRAYQDNYTITGPHGRQATFNDTGACHYGQCTRQEQYTNWNGRSRSVNVTSDRIGPRTWAETETITNRSGQQRTFEFLRRR